MTDVAQPARRAAFFDRDGVINVDRGYVHRADQLVFVPGAARALRVCHELGFLVFVVTNQSGVARGYYDEAAVQVFHAHLRAELARAGAILDDLRYCPHHRDGTVTDYMRDCACRKPAPGMILDLLRQWNVDPARSFLVGDQASDMAAAHAAGIAGHLFVGGDLADFVVPIARAVAPA